MNITTIEAYLALIQEILALWSQFQAVPLASPAPAAPSPLSQAFANIGKQVAGGLPAEQHANIGATVSATMLAVLLSGKQGA